MSKAGARASGAAVDRTFVAVATCFVLSGFAALLYQTVWMREFSILFGTSELAIATVLAAYMGGLALGAAAAARFVERITRPVLFYGLLELGVAVGALLVPVGLSLAQGLLVATLGGQPELHDAGGAGNSLFYLAVGFAIVVLPTAFMGATLPVLTRQAVRTTQEIGRRTGFLYALNTAGAVFGTVFCAFLFLPAFGLFVTTLIGVGLNALIFVIAIRIDPAREEEGARLEPIPEGDREVQQVSAFRGNGVILPLILVSGAVSFAYEVLWTRLLAHILGTSLFSFATMLATFLMGITLGSAAASRLAKDLKSSALGFVVAQAGTAFSALFVFAALDQVPAAAASLSAGEQAGLAANSIVAGLVLFPTAFFIGSTFPFAVRILAREGREAAPASARVYAWNTVGAILGSILAGFLVIPRLGFTGTVALAVTVNLALGAVCAVRIARLAPKVWLGLCGAGVFFLAVLFPGQPERLLLMSPVTKDAIEGGNVLYTGVGRSATVLLVEKQGIYYLRTNGLPEALIAPKGAVPLLQQSGWWLGALPPLAHPDAKSMLVVGLGGGVMIEGVPSTIETIDVIELEPKVEEANRAIRSLRRTDPLADPRVKIHYNDARGALALTDKRWDIIVSQPSHPWTAGASHLYTREFMEEIQEHLTEGGVFCQGYLDESILGYVGATLSATFPHTRLYNAGSYLYLASSRPIDLLSPSSRSQEVIDADPDLYRWLGVHTREDLAAALVLTHDGVQAYSQDSPIITDDRNALATAPPHLVQTERDPNDRNPRLDELDPYQRPGEESLIAALDLPGPHLVRRMAGIGFTRRAQKVAASLSDPGDRELALLLADPQPVTDPKRLQELMEEHPGHAGLRFRCLSLLAAQRQPTAAELRSLDPAARAALTANRLAVEGGATAWLTISRLEEDLASARSTDLAYELSLYYRAAWRLSLGSQQDIQSRAPEALRIIDELVAVHPQDRYYTLRMGVAALLKDPFTIVETASAMTDFLSKTWTMLPPPRRQTLAQLTIQRLANAQTMDDCPRERAREVRSRLRSISGL